NDIVPVSALEKLNIDELFAKILEHTPIHPPYYPTDSLTDRPERFFASEIVREKIFLNYKKEIPYSTEVVITEFKEDEKIIRMRAELHVERNSQKGILIGHKGESLKKVGIEARKDLEEFFQKQVHLETFVKVTKDWRKQDLSLKRFGYKQ
ncbi:MAG: GTPase Era, partial [Bacteroidota bacterium]